MNTTTMSETTSLFRECLANIPPVLDMQLSASYDISDKIYSVMQRKGISYTELAQRTGHTEDDVAQWVGGGYDFNLSTLAKISAALGEPIVGVV